MDPTPLSSKAGALYSKIERYVLQNIDSPKLGRGSHLDYVHRPLMDLSKPWIWGKERKHFGPR